MQKIQFLSFILILFSCATKSSPKEEVLSYEYRLGDIIRFKEYRESKDGKEHYYKKFPSSIATEYMRKTYSSNDLSVLTEIIEKREKETSNLPSKDELVMHLRIGDVIDEMPESVDKFLSETVYYPNGNNYVKPLSYYIKITDLIANLPIKKITLVGGFHRQSASREKSYEYVHRVKNFLEEKGYQVSLRIGNDADTDFVYMTNARFFVPSGGGFSLLIKKLTLKKGGQVIEVEL